MVCSTAAAEGFKMEDEEDVVVVLVTAVEIGARVFHSLTVQSRALERTRSPRSTGPRAGWKSRLMTGAAWPLYRMRVSTPALAPARS